MADYCNLCDTRRPLGGTNHLVLGSAWIEFCDVCGELEMLTNAETGETACVADVFEDGEQKLDYRTPEFKAEWAAVRKQREERAAEEERQKEAARAKLKGGLNAPTGGEAVGLFL